MAYTTFDDDKPVSTDNALTIPDDIRTNLMALRDSVVGGSMEGWNYSKTDGTGTAEQPQYIFYKKGNLWLRGTLTWGTTGGADGNIESELWEYSSDGVPTYSTIGTETFTYDVDGELSISLWT